MSNVKIDRTRELERRLAAIHTSARDTCAFFANTEGDSDCFRECWYCEYGEFDSDAGDVNQMGLCNFRRECVGTSNAELVKTKRMLEALVANIKGGVITCLFNARTQSSETIYINRGWTTLTGYTLDELNSKMGGNPQSLVLADDKPTADMEYMQQTQNSDEYELMYRVRKKNGSIIWVLDRGVVTIMDNGDVQNQSIITEVTELKEQEEHMRRLAQVDSLTGLYNRGAVTVLAERMLMLEQNDTHAVMMLDIDCFKGINDSLGHSFGDDVLKAVADALSGLFRYRDIIGRLGGDEFIIFMPSVPSADAAQKKAGEICAAARAINFANVKHPPVSVSVGVTLSAQGETWQTLYERADAALYRAKNNGKDQYMLDVPSINR